MLLEFQKGKSIMKSTNIAGFLTSHCQSKVHEILVNL
jgi:hypothetical protein